MDLSCFGKFKLGFEKFILMKMLLNLYKSVKIGLDQFLRNNNVKSTLILEKLKMATTCVDLI